MPASQRILALAALAVAVVANPVAEPGKLPKQAYLDSIEWGTAVGGALDLPTPTTTKAPNKEAVTALAQDGQLTVTVRNKHWNPIQTGHVNNPGPGPVAGNTDPRQLQVGEEDWFVVPAGWGGRVVFADVKDQIRGDETLIEGSFGEQGQGFPQSDINISMVDGFSLPASCWCTNDSSFIVGCNKWLWDLNPCQDDNGVGSCRNPRRYDGINDPIDFFRPCYGYAGAYTFPNDSEANQLNQKCPDNEITCCIGTDCPAPF